MYIYIYIYIYTNELVHYLLLLYPSLLIETANHFPFFISQVFSILITKENLQMIRSIFF